MMTAQLTVFVHLNGIFVNQSIALLCLTANLEIQFTPVDPLNWIATQSIQKFDCSQYLNMAAVLEGN